MRARIKIIVRDGKIEIQYPQIGQRCFTIGKNVRDALRSVLEVENEEVKPILASDNTIAQKQKKMEVV